MGTALRVALRRNHFGSGTVAQVEIAGKTGLRNQVGFGGPVAVVFLNCRKSVAQPSAVLCPLKYAQDHLGEKRRLRSGQIICPVGIEDFPVVSDFVQEIVRHVLCEADLAVAQKAQLYEITVPPVHFVETASRHDVRPRQIEQALIGERAKDRVEAAAVRSFAYPRASSRGQAVFPSHECQTGGRCRSASGHWAKDGIWDPQPPKQDRGWYASRYARSA